MEITKVKDIMDSGLKKNATIHISDRHHLNITVNIFHCGNMDYSNGEEENDINKLDYFILYYVNSGKGSITCNDIKMKINENQGFVVFPHMEISFKPALDEVLNVTWVALSGYRVEDYLYRAGVTQQRPIFSDEDLYIKEKLSDLLKVAEKPTNRYCKMVSIIYDIISNMLDNPQAKRQGNSPYTMEFYTTKAIDYIEANYCHAITVDNIANFLGITRKHFHYVFKTTINLSPKEYIIYLRVVKACEALRSSAYSIIEISQSVGYSNQFYFSKEFKRIVGMTPSEYRNNSQSNGADNYDAEINKIKQKLAPIQNYESK